MHTDYSCFSHCGIIKSTFSLDIESCSSLSLIILSLRIYKCNKYCRKWMIWKIYSFTNSQIFTSFVKNAKKKRQFSLESCRFFLAPPVGLEPTTPWLTVRCSTDWAKEEYRKDYWNGNAEWCRNKHRSVFAKNREKYGYKCRQRLIFPGRFQPSIFSTDELNCRVRNGNGWTLIVTGTDFWCTFRDSNPGPTD